ncbi:hypothetical protein LN050_11050 [Comamonadaceae bacterium M7527]|nr:hypothetical protein LN050_11050 [Comamonadaceae bacterium M7527]
MLKLLLVAAVVMFGVWLFRKDRTGVRPPPAAKKPSTPTKALAALPMVACSHCGTHTDARDVVHGQLGVYCSKAHCQLSGDRAKH